MTGGGRLVMALAFFPFFLAAAVFAADDAKPPVAEIKPMADIFHGTTVIDNYRWLENAESAEKNAEFVSIAVQTTLRLSLQTLR